MVDVNTQVFFIYHAEFRSRQRYIIESGACPKKLIDNACDIVLHVLAQILKTTRICLLIS